ncbi:unnamed protein product [Strongylus vulgaris]|uniref:Uncharacterized protein n=1 Tax=Strongylus vulgaris TaxID=40348 RepID=A0A3P7JGE3_STRVU|nr:unnamed protein product [Strongylus vulgaris]
MLAAHVMRNFGTPFMLAERALKLHGILTRISRAHEAPFVEQAGFRKCSAAWILSVGDEVIVLEREMYKSMGDSSRTFVSRTTLFFARKMPEGDAERIHEERLLRGSGNSIRRLNRGVSFGRSMDMGTLEEELNWRRGLAWAAFHEEGHRDELGGPQL